ncbi:hypothetical protein [Draconibacterium orientale]|uniref:hypothetical protein n=1 Tax=Draconibacterium orientale TaxID=1168034 RepID=UPI0029BFE976|nr:hypothetical protein [Draconibacterium orientale]
MQWKSFNTYGDNPNNAFETLCNQLFERYLKRNYLDELIKFRVIKGAGGDGGIEAYGKLKSEAIIAVQSKWFPQKIDKQEIAQIRRSITTAKDLRPQIIQYFICIPHDVGSLKYGKGKAGESKKPINSYEEKIIDDFTNEIVNKYPDLEITWWFEKDIELELQQPENEGVFKFWFDKEIISINYLEEIFEFQKKGWLHARYIPELHGQGVINKEYQKLCFSAKYRKEFHKDVKGTIIELQNGITLIDKFLPTFQSSLFLKKRLLVIKRNIQRFKDEFNQLLNAIDDGNDFFKVRKVKEVAMWKTIKDLEKIKPNNIQKNILPALVTSLNELYRYDLPKYLSDIALEIIHSVRLILGEPGTGKTHGLANCVDQHIHRKSPAVIIQAKGCPCRNWTDILSDVLNLKQWSESEIFNALEALATRNDIQKVAALKTKEEHTYECSKVLICIDGLEEDIENADEWYGRIRQSLLISQRYQRIRFIFSARRYFYDNTQVPERGIFEEVTLPREGDVPILKIAKRYFNKEHYNIQIPSFSIIKGINSLFALRLFCEEYKNTTILGSDQILIVERDLINSKIDRINQEFCSVIQIGKSRNPVLDAMETISEYFYFEIEIEHEQLITVMSPSLQKYLSIKEMDLLLDFLANNGFLIRSEREEKTEFLRKRKTYYNITYQSLIEHILIEKTIHKIKNGTLNHIPKIFERGMIAPLDDKPQDIFNPSLKPYNKRVVQGIVDRVFLETEKLIGDKDFLIEGFKNKEVVEMRMDALSHATEKIALPYKKEIDNMFFGGYKTQFIVLKNLIFPSSSSLDNYFGAEYLHKILINQTSVFERDKLWSGLDRYEKRNLTEEDTWRYEYESIFRVFDEIGMGNLYLSEWDKHNEEPLLYAWGLSTIDQKLRSKLRIALTEWAIQNPSEYLLLLDKIFFCNDPQIQEDLSSVMLGVASRLKKKKKTKAFAEWALTNIFSNLDTHRNVIVRQGFRAIVERAFQYGVISKVEVELCRPNPMNNITLIPLDIDYLKSPKEEFYPIVHDLAWYVIKNAYDDFLEYPSSISGKTKSNDCREALNLVQKYWKEYNTKRLYAHGWAMAAAIGYIKSIGLARIQGNGFTDATHGSKSDVFTYEEKYTWLAVHYLQGYLSDYIPMKQWSDNREFLTDYTQITDIPNPAEFIIDLKEIDEQSFKSKDWIVKEILSKELEEEIEIKENLTNWVNEEPALDFKNWLIFESNDFEIKDKTSKWVALYNHTGLHDSKEMGYTFLDAKACIVNKDDLETLIFNMSDNSNKLDLTFHMDSLLATPRTSTYCNPTDIVWMSWIEEDGDIYSFYDNNSGNEKELKVTIAKVVRNTMDGEEYFMLPSKKIRETIGVCELVGEELKDINQKTVAFIHKLSTGFHKDNQELVLVDKEILEAAIEKEGYDLVWIITIYKEKNPLNESLPKDFHVRKSRKYFVWSNNVELKTVKFWDEESTNVRDNEKFN